MKLYSICIFQPFVKTSSMPAFHNQNMFWIQVGCPPLKSDRSKAACKNCSGVFSRPGEPGFLTPADLYVMHVEKWYYTDMLGIKRTSRAGNNYLLQVMCTSEKFTFKNFRNSYVSTPKL